MEGQVRATFPTWLLPGLHQFLVNGLNCHRSGYFPHCRVHPACLTFPRHRLVIQKRTTLHCRHRVGLARLLALTLTLVPWTTHTIGTLLSTMSVVHHPHLNPPQGQSHPRRLDRMTILRNVRHHPGRLRPRPLHERWNRNSSTNESNLKNQYRLCILLPAQPVARATERRGRILIKTIVAASAATRRELTKELVLIHKGMELQVSVSLQLASRTAHRILQLRHQYRTVQRRVLGTTEVDSMLNATVMIPSPKMEALTAAMPINSSLDLMANSRRSANEDARPPKSLEISPAGSSHVSLARRCLLGEC